MFLRTFFFDDYSDPSNSPGSELVALIHVQIEPGTEATADAYFGGVPFDYLLSIAGSGMRIKLSEGLEFYLQTHILVALHLIT